MSRIGCILTVFVMFAGCGSAQTTGAPASKLSQQTIQKVKQIVETSMDDRLGFHHGRFDHPVSAEALNRIRAIPGYQQALTAMLKEQLDEELSARAEGMVAGDFPLMTHICEMMAELGDPVFEESLETLRERTHLIRIHGAATRALRRLRRRGEGAQDRRQ